LLEKKILCATFSQNPFISYTTFSHLNDTEQKNVITDLLLHISEVYSVNMHYTDQDYS